jgi:hypothetical protein
MWKTLLTLFLVLCTPGSILAVGPQGAGQRDTAQSNARFIERWGRNDHFLQHSSGPPALDDYRRWRKRSASIVINSMRGLELDRVFQAE